MLKEANNAGFAVSRKLLGRRYRFRAGAVECERAMGRGEFAAAAADQATRPVAVAISGRRRYWWFRDRFWWDDSDLAADDVVALVAERERRARRRLDRAHAVLAAEQSGMTERSGISAEVKRIVWERCRGTCAECGTDQLLEFDHVIPLAMGGSNGSDNLQLLCLDCNRAKGGDL